jgi:hypothetical protein
VAFSTGGDGGRRSPERTMRTSSAAASDNARKTRPKIAH